MNLFEVTTFSTKHIFDEMSCIVVNRLLTESPVSPRLINMHVLSMRFFREYEKIRKCSRGLTLVLLAEEAAIPKEEK